MDTPYFLRHLETINEQGDIQKNAMLVTWDVVGLFTNIPHTEGLTYVREALHNSKHKQEHQNIPNEIIV